MSHPNILIVDDSPANITAMKTVLEPLDLVFLTAKTGNEALSQMLRNKIAVVLLDIQMPDMNGFEVAELMTLHEETRYIPIIFVTAGDKDDKHIFKGYAVGAVDYIHKPFDPNVLKSKVSVFLKLYNQREELTKQKDILTNTVQEKEKLIGTIEEQNKRKDLLLSEIQNQKQRLDNYFWLKLWAVFGTVAALVYIAYASWANADLLAKTNQAYKRFIPFDILNLLNKDNVADVHLGDQVLKEMIVLFADVRNYSTIAESLTPSENLTFINKILKIIQNPIIERKGIINKYLGDGLMALFHQEANEAVDASIVMLKNISSLSQERLGEEKSPIHIGVGIDMGEMIVGTVGTEDRMEQTVIADAVNVASRIEGLTKIYGASLLISEKIYKHLKNTDKYTIRFLDTVRVKGRKTPVIVYHVIDGECCAAKDLYKKTMPDFSEGILLFREKKFAESKLAFEKVLQVHHEDRAAQIYVERANKYMHQGVSDDWTHVETLDHK